MTRSEVLSNALDNCIKELYSFVQPSIDWEEFKKENKNYSDKYKAWERYKILSNKENLSEDDYKELWSYPSKWKDKTITECIGPRPYEFYYLPKEIMKDICDSYVYAYRMNSQQELLNTIEILKKYCKEPIIDKWIEGENGYPGYKGYDRPDSLVKQLTNLIPDSGFDKSVVVESVQNKFFEFLDMAGNFYNWNGELNSFNMSVYLGPSPNSNKEKVIENWKLYRNKDIKIDEEQMKNEYYGLDD